MKIAVARETFTVFLVFLEVSPGFCTQVFGSMPSGCEGVRKSRLCFVSFSTKVCSQVRVRKIYCYCCCTYRLRPFSALLSLDSWGTVPVVMGLSTVSFTPDFPVEINNPILTCNDNGCCVRPPFPFSTVVSSTLYMPVLPM